MLGGSWVPREGGAEGTQQISAGKCAAPKTKPGKMCLSVKYGLDKGEHSRQGGGAQQCRRGNQNSGNREPEWSKWWSVRMGGSDNKGDGLASQPRR